MEKHNGNAITFDELSSIIRAHLPYVETLEALGLLAEIASVINSPEIAFEILQKIETKLEEKINAGDFFAFAESAKLLGVEEFEVRFLLRGFQLLGEKGGAVSEYPEELERMQEINPRNHQMRKFIEVTIDRRMEGLRQHGDGIVKGMMGESWSQEVLRLISFIACHWSDYRYCAVNTFELLGIESIDSEDRLDAEESLINYMKKLLDKNERREIGIVYSKLTSREVHWQEYDGQFQELLEEYHSIITTNRKD